MFKKIMWATDGSEAADRALTLARTLADDAGGELLVVHCQERTEPYRTGGAYPSHPDANELKSKVEKQVADLSETGVFTTLELTEARAGGAAHAIADVAESRGADVIVAGTRGHTPLAGLLLGSVTQRLLQIAPCPVLAVPARAPQRES
jgi:nucleotide-binding universal stress UspA family protein